MSVLNILKFFCVHLNTYINKKSLISRLINIYERFIMDCRLTGCKSKPHYIKHESTCQTTPCVRMCQASSIHYLTVNPKIIHLIVNITVNMNICSHEFFCRVSHSCSCPRITHSRSVT